MSGNQPRGSWRSFQSNPPPYGSVILFRCKVEASTQTYAYRLRQGWQHDGQYLVGVLTWTLDEHAMMRLRDLPNREWMEIPR